MTSLLSAYFKCGSVNLGALETAFRCEKTPLDAFMRAKATESVLGMFRKETVIKSTVTVHFFLFIYFFTSNTFPVSL